MLCVMQKLRAPTWQDVVLLIALLLLALELAAGLAHYASLAGSAISFHYPLDYGEGPVLDQTMKLAQGINPYLQGIHTPPYNIANDPPLFQWVQVPFALAGGPAYGYGRALSLLSTLASALFIALIVHRLTGDVMASVIPALLFFTFPHIAYWSLFNRVDTLALALSLAALYAVVRRPDQRVAIIGAAALFIASIFTRQSYLLAGPFTACCYLLYLKQRRQAAVLAGIVAGATIGVAGVLAVLTQGGFLFHTVTANANPWISYIAVDYYINLVVNTPLLLVGALLFLVLERTGERTQSWPFVLIYLTFAALAGLGVGKVGSNLNDLYELVAALCMVAGALVAWLAPLPVLRILAVIALAAQVSGLREWTEERYTGKITARISTAREIAQLNAMAAQPEPLLADEFMGLMPLNRKPIEIQPFEFNMLNIAGMWSEADLIARIQRREFKTIALYEPIGGESAMIVTRWPKTVRDAIYANYEMKDRLAENLIYLPKSP
jgi:hypothetical protein